MDKDPMRGKIVKRSTFRREISGGWVTQAGGSLLLVHPHHTLYLQKGSRGDGARCTNVQVQ